MAESFQNVLKTLQPIPRMYCEFIPENKTESIPQKSQFFSMCFQHEDVKIPFKDNRYAPLKETDLTLDNMDIRQLVMGARHEIQPKVEEAASLTSNLRNCI